MDEALRAELVGMWQEDQELAVAVFERTRHDPALRQIFLFELPEERWPEGYAACRAQAHRNVTRVADIVDVHGWPGRSMVGEDGAAAAWGIAQHADGDQALRRRLLPALAAAVRAGEVPGDHLAALTDRVLLADGLPQRYGTLIQERDGKWVLREPIEDESSLDRRRAEIGVGPWRDWVALVPPPAQLYSEP